MKKNDAEKTVKKRHSLFMRWEFDAAADEFNQMSENGWQLVRCKPFTQTYVYNPDVTYRYQIDCNDTVSDPARYLQTFAEGGWIPVMSNWGGWHIFAKKYVPGQPEEAYMIYTDEQSGKSDMTVCWTPVLQALNVYLFSRWYFSVRSLEKGKKPRRFHFLVFVVIAALIIIASLVSILR